MRKPLKSKQELKEENLKRMTESQRGKREEEKEKPEKPAKPVNCACSYLRAEYLGTQCPGPPSFSLSIDSTFFDHQKYRLRGIVTMSGG